jgi:hypothetical protein
MQRTPAISPLPWLMAVVLALAIAVSALAQGSGGVAATITLVEGQAEVVPAGSTTPTPARPNMRVLPGSTVRTKANGRVELQFDDRSLLRLDHNTEVQILSGPQQRGVMVTLGNIWAKVQSIFGASKFQVKTPTVVAGVRGTILRAEVSDQEAAIAVDEGEVEVTPTDGDQPVIVRQNQQVRVPRGKRDLRPGAFDPEARPKWEFWTDPLAQQEVQGIQEAAAAAKQACAEVHQRTQDIHQALAVDGQAAWRLSMQVGAANKLVASVQSALSGPPRRGMPPGPPPTKAALLARLDAADSAYTQAAPLVSRGREAMQQHTADVEGLRDAVGAQQSAQGELAGKLKAFRDRREVDPHWQAFRQPCEQSEAYRDHIAGSLSACKPLLSPDVPGNLGNDPQKMASIQQRFVWGTKVLDALDKQIGDGQDEVARLRGIVNGWPDGPVKPPRPPGGPR